MSAEEKDDKKDTTAQLVAEAEALRGSGSGKKAPRTRQLVRDAERLIGRPPQSAAFKPLMWALVVGAGALILAVLYFFFA